MVVANTLTYYVTATITAVKRFLVKTPMAATVAVLAPFAPITLGDMTEIEMFLFVCHCQRGS